MDYFNFLKSDFKFLKFRRRGSSLENPEKWIQPVTFLHRLRSQGQGTRSQECRNLTEKTYSWRRTESGGNPSKRYVPKNPVTRVSVIVMRSPVSKTDILNAQERSKKK